MYTGKIKVYLPPVELAYIEAGLARLGYASLDEFRHSQIWKDRHERYYQSHEYKCVKCPRRRRLQLTHLTYRNLGHELDSQLEWKCGYHHAGEHRSLNARVKKARKHESVVHMLIWG